MLMLALSYVVAASGGGGTLAAAAGAAASGSAGGGGGNPYGVAPAPTDLPGFSVFQRLTNGLDGWALIAAIVGIIIGAVMWAFGHYSQNWQQSYNGRRGVIASALAAILIGGAPYIVKFFVGMGSTL
jgi:hypothetical protein